MPPPSSFTSSKPSLSQRSPMPKTSGHVWNQLLRPWFFSNFDQILGPKNPGSIDFLMVDREFPTICITASNTALVDRRPIDQKPQEVSPNIPFQVEIRCGTPARTGHASSGSSISHPWPAGNPSYSQIPYPGCSIGVENTGNTASFGGFIQILHTPNSRPQLYGLTCHHLLEDRPTPPSSFPRFTITPRDVAVNISWKLCS